MTNQLKFQVQHQICKEKVIKKSGLSLVPMLGVSSSTVQKALAFMEITKACDWLVISYCHSYANDTFIAWATYTFLSREVKDTCSINIKHTLEVVISCDGLVLRFTHPDLLITAQATTTRDGWFCLVLLHSGISWISVTRAQLPLPGHSLLLYLFQFLSRYRLRLSITSAKLLNVHIYHKLWHTR